MNATRPLLLALALLLAAIPVSRSGEQELHVGYFPNITHAHALIAQNMASDGADWFAERLPGVTVKWHSFNAGPSAMEALFAKAVDMTYVGPNPVLNAFIRSRGGVAVVAGAVRGGAGLVVPGGSDLAKPEDFRGKRIATPQLANTQDIAARQWLIRAGLKITMRGGDASVVPVANPQMLPMFLSGDIDAAWTVEPWVSRLELDGGGILVYAEPPETSITTVLSAGATLLKANPETAAAFVAAHRELTAWIRDNPEEARRRVVAELTRQMRSPFPEAIAERAWPRLIFDDAIRPEEFDAAYRAAVEAGFLKPGSDIGRLVDAR